MFNTHKQAMETQVEISAVNAKILADRVSLLNERTDEPRVGDYLKLPHGDYQRFTMSHEETIQTGSAGRSYYLGSSGYISYSGGLDAGVKKSDLKLTEEVKDGIVWFFDEGFAGANRGKEFRIPFRVYELVEGADISGLPAIKKYEEKLLAEQAEKITRINGNGQEYTLPLPRVRIIAGYDKVDEVKKKLKRNIKLDLEVLGNVLAGQIMTHVQFEKLKSLKGFKSTFYNNCTYNNTLMLEIEKFTY